MIAKHRLPKVVLPFIGMSFSAVSIIFLMQGCSSKGTRGDAPDPIVVEKADANSAGSGSANFGNRMDNGDDDNSGGQTGSKKEVIETAAPKKDIPLDPRYKQLGLILRGQSGSKLGSVQDEAARILGTNPNDPVALNTLALIYLKRGKHGAAKLLLQRALEKDSPSAAGLRNNLGVVLLEENERDGAAAQFKKALQIDDRNGEASGNLGSIYAQNGDFQRALPLLETSYRQNKFNVQIANNYAVALRVGKDLEGARKVYEAILQINSKEVNTLLNFASLLIDHMNNPKAGLDLVYKVKFLESERKDVLMRANALEIKAKSELK